MNSNDLKQFLKFYLQEQLGYYIINTQEIPAIRQDTSALPILKKSGLEVVISIAPTSIKAGMNTIKKIWNINLVQHNGNHTLEQAIERLALLDNFESYVLLPAYSLPTRDSKIPEQAIITICDMVGVKVESMF